MDREDVWELTVLCLSIVSGSVTLDIAFESWIETQDFSLHFVHQTGLQIGTLFGTSGFLLLHEASFFDLFSNTCHERNLLGSVFLQRITTALEIWIVWIIFFLPSGNLPEDPSLRRWHFRSISNHPSFRSLFRILMLQRLPFIAFEFLLPFKLIEKGLSFQSIAVSKLLDATALFLSGSWVHYVMRNTVQKRPWIFAYFLRLCFGICIVFILYYLPETLDTTHWPFLTTLLLLNVLSNALGNIVFTSQRFWIESVTYSHSEAKALKAFFTGVCSVSHFLPKALVFVLVDRFSHRICFRQNQSYVDVPCPWAPLFGSNDLCFDSGGVCRIVKDGFYPVAFGSLGMGFILLLYFSQVVRHFALETSHRS